ncbi:hypothetical protein CLV24_12632 [Pontibacter ummariensis]|uniref:Exosortase F-associated protein n=1 Tax=Pontibacter ummariensis TaxID=1610492 RepID=A0A239K4W7_9BACT|nr:hypothetical protein CLV24_12632 [Pontibacter ummariensis]SNT13061.1 hypothetical protein SAMN06296052_12621 [Pontibacter ummariensis]
MSLPQLFNLHLRLLIIGKWLLLITLIVALLLYSYHEALIYKQLSESLKRLTTVDSFTGILPDTYSQTLKELMKGGRRLIMLGYRLFFCVLSLLIVHVYFLNYTKTKVATVLYSCAMLLYLLLYGVAKGFNSEPLLLVAIQIDSFILSPALIMLIIPAFHLAAPKKEAI